MQHTCSNNINPLVKFVVVSCSLMRPKTLKRDFLQTVAIHDNKEEADNFLLTYFHSDISFGMNKYGRISKGPFFVHIISSTVEGKNSQPRIRTPSLPEYIVPPYFVSRSQKKRKQH